MGVTNNTKANSTPSKPCKSSKPSKSTNKKRPVFSSPLVQAHTTPSTTLTHPNTPTDQPPTPNHHHHPNDDDDHDSTSETATKRAKLQQQAKDAEEAEEQRLTDLLFGHTATAPSTSTPPTDHDEPTEMDEYEDEYKDDVDVRDENGRVLFELDRTSLPLPASTPTTSSSPTITTDPNPPIQSPSSSPQSNTNDKTNPPPAWIDTDDENLRISLSKSSNRVRKLRTNPSEDMVDGTDYEQRLRQRFLDTSSMVRTDWAKVKSSTKEESEEDEYGISRTAARLLSSNTPLLSTSTSTSTDLTSHPRRLPPHQLKLVRYGDVNRDGMGNCAVQSVGFHKGEVEDPLVFTAGLDKTVRFFRVREGGERCEKVHGIHFPNMPIRTASFLGTTGSLIVSGRRPFFYLYDSIAGKIDKVPRIPGRSEKSLEQHVVSPDGSLIAFLGNDGYVVLVEAKSKLWVADMKMNGSVRAVAFTECGRYIVSSGSDGDVYKWDIRTTLCSDRFQNEDGTITSSISTSERFLAVGAESGIVNLYDETNQPSPFQPRTPCKSLTNLRTSVDFSQFNHDGDILAVSTRREKDGLKLLHVPTKTVFSNWPTSKTPLGYVWSMGFSPESRFLAVGNDKGRCLLYKLAHYNS